LEHESGFPSLKLAARHDAPLGETTGRTRGVGHGLGGSTGPKLEPDAEQAALRSRVGEGEADERMDVEAGREVAERQPV